MNRKLWPYALIATLALLLALWSLYRKPADNRPGKPWITLDAADLIGIEWQKADRLVRVEPLGLGLAWTKVSDKTGLREEYLIGERLRDIVFNLSPVWATRSLGRATEKKLKEYGFDGQERKLTLQLRNRQPVLLHIGGRGFRSEDNFVFDPSRGEVFLWDRQAIDLLGETSRLAIRTLSFLDPEGINRFEIIDARNPKLNRGLVKLQKVWREGEQTVSSEEPVLAWLEQFAKASIHGYRQRPEALPKTLLTLRLELESILSVKLLVEEKAASYWLDFGEGRPLILLDKAEIEALLKLWQTQRKP